MINNIFYFTFYRKIILTKHVDHVLRKCFVCEEFVSTVKKQVIENKQAFGGTHTKDYS